MRGECVLDSSQLVHPQVYTWNNMQNLYEETTLNQTSDLILHAGDHCCNLGCLHANLAAVGWVPWFPGRHFL